MANPIPQYQCDQCLRIVGLGQRGGLCSHPGCDGKLTKLPIQNVGRGAAKPPCRTKDFQYRCNHCDKWFDSPVHDVEGSKCGSCDRGTLRALAENERSAPNDMYELIAGHRLEQPSTLPLSFTAAVARIVALEAQVARLASQLDISFRLNRLEGAMIGSGVSEGVSINSLPSDAEAWHDALDTNHKEWTAMAARLIDRLSEIEAAMERAGLMGPDGIVGGI